eukprot:TRINITY_DN68237_c0_g1_i1.p1 TRINITY_DN68237_c0_g1~~TRINITY_DN68237_c0_g1_i1.p1  ORF type:complete len:769 (-),score=52.38 TRINITY_DN68237_c0_g1_i1:51-2357(-)
MFPRVYQGRLFYYLDANGDGKFLNNRPLADAVPVYSLQHFLPKESGGSLTDKYNTISVGGVVFRVPSAELLNKIVVGEEPDRGTRWPDNRDFTSSTGAPFDVSTGEFKHYVVSFRRRQKQTRETWKHRAYSDKDLMAVEVVSFIGSVPYDQEDGACRAADGGRPLRSLEPGSTWALGRNLFTRDAIFGSILSCTLFCSAHVPECRGFSYYFEYHLCFWHRGDFRGGDTKKPGTACFISELFACRIFEGRCGDGFIFTEEARSKWCTDNICTVSECCTPNDLCTPDVCGEMNIIKPDPPQRCAGVRCEINECCNPRAQCDEKVCPPPAYRLNVGDLALCPGTTCSHDDCCLESRICRDDDCPAPFGLKTLDSNQPVYCAEQTHCTVLECCVQVGSCKTHKCRPGDLPRSKETLCQGMVCEDEECCDPLGSCINQTKLCHTGFRLKEGRELPTVCGGKECLVSECCKNVAQCSLDVCRRGWALISTKVVFCKDAVCKLKECCVKAGKCTAMTCPEGHRMLTFNEGFPDFCQRPVCTVAECCLQQGQCSGNVCPVGWAWLEPKKLPRFCRNSVCLPTECCEALGKCTLDVCGVGYRSIETGAAFCKTSTCTVKECCIRLASCSDRPDICSRGQGYLPKRNPARFCSSYFCTVSECCDLAAICSQDVCGVGAKLTYNLYCNSADFCRAEECCDTPGKPAALLETSGSAPEANSRPIAVGASRRTARSLTEAVIRAGPTTALLRSHSPVGNRPPRRTLRWLLVGSAVPIVFHF